MHLAMHIFAVKTSKNIDTVKLKYTGDKKQMLPHGIGWKTVLFDYLL